MADDAAPFPYLRWAKAHLGYGEPHMMGMSGLPRPHAGTVPGLLGLPDAAGGLDTAAALRGAVGARHGRAAEHVLLTAGTSHANFAIYLALARGARVAAETPAYEAFFRLGDAVGAEVVPFRRGPGAGWRIDPATLREATRGDVKLVVVSDLHNPSGARLHDDDLQLLLEASHRTGATVLVDEVYLELDDPPRPSAAVRCVGEPDRVLITNSLTKAHGLGDLRIGWVVGSPELLQQIDRWNDLVCPVLPPLPMQEALRYLPHADDRLAHVRARCAALTDRVDAWVGTRHDVAWTRPDGGFTGLLDLGHLDGDAVALRAWEDARVRTVPGSFFQCRSGLRISYWLPDADLDEALAGLGHALDRFA